MTRPKPAWWRTLDALGHELHDFLDQMNDRALTALRDLPARDLTTTNCWYLTYGLAPIVSSLAADILRSRAGEVTFEAARRDGATS